MRPAPLDDDRPGGLQDVWLAGWRFICPICHLLSKRPDMCRGEGTVEPHVPRRRMPWLGPAT
jgi:hypothetical protein